MSGKLAIRKSRIYGRGCFALVPFRERKKIACYKGELIRGHWRIKARLRSQTELRVIWLDDEIAIDGAVGGDETAYINHCCEPNAFMRRAGDRIVFFALRDIEPGEEITINYRDPEHPEVCRCGARACRSKSVKRGARNGSRT